MKDNLVPKQKIVGTKKLLKKETKNRKEEFFKQNTLIAQTLLDFRKEMRISFKQIDKRFGQIDKRFGQIDERFGQIDERFDSLDKKFVTKVEWTDQMDLIMGEFKILRENQAANAMTTSRHSDRLEAIETHLNLVAT